MRSRYIRPGICTNEDLAEIGPYAYILFTGLWMMADRDGRLEYRPKRIKAQVMPLWDEVTVGTVEMLVEKLAERRMLQVYTCDGLSLIAICNWCKHQHLDPREKSTNLPAPPDSRSVREVLNGRDSTTYGNTMSEQCLDTVQTVSNRLEFGVLSLESGASAVAKIGSSTEAVEKSTPPKKKEQNQHERKPPARAPSLVSAPKQNREEVELLRSSLVELAKQINMPPPDTQIVERVLDAGNGASVEQIHATLVELWKRNKFRGMYSWGFVPLVIGQCFRAA